MCIFLFIEVFTHDMTLLLIKFMLSFYNSQIVDNAAVIIPYKMYSRVQIYWFDLYTYFYFYFLSIVKMLCVDNFKSIVVLEKNKIFDILLSFK